MGGGGGYWYSQYSLFLSLSVQRQFNEISCPFWYVFLLRFQYVDATIQQHLPENERV